MTGMLPAKRAAASQTSAVTAVIAGTTHAACLHACLARAKKHFCCQCQQAALAVSCTPATLCQGQRISGEKCMAMQHSKLEACTCWQAAISASHRLAFNPAIDPPGQCHGTQQAARTDRPILFLLCRSKHRTSCHIKLTNSEHPTSTYFESAGRRPNGCHIHAVQ